MGIFKISLYVSTGWYFFIWLVSVSEGAILPLIFYSYVSNFVGAAIGYAVFTALSAEVVPIEDEDVGIAMALSSLLFMFALPLVIYGGSDFSDSGIMGVAKAIKFSYLMPLIMLFYVIIGGLGALALAFTSPVWGILAIVGWLKILIYLKNRPAALDAVTSGEVFDIKPIMDELEARMANEPTGVFANWESTTRTYWANKLADQYEAGTRAARATNEAHKAARVRKEMDDE
jgi:hypothetical protein